MRGESAAEQLDRYIDALQRGEEPEIAGIPLFPRSAATAKQNVDPAPASDSTQIVPPSPSTMLLQTAKPMPVPGISSVCRRVKRLNTR